MYILFKNNRIVGYTRNKMYLIGIHFIRRIYNFVPSLKYVIEKYFKVRVILTFNKILKMNSYDYME